MLQKGVGNRIPPKPRYCVIWDVEVVLDYLRDKCSDDSKLSIMELSEKTVALLALATASRGSELRLLDISLMAETESKIHFWFKEQPKGCRGQKLPKPLEVLASGMQLCPVRTTRAYIKRTAYEKRPSQLFLSTYAPYHPISRATIGRWLTNVLGKAGIDTAAFGAHSFRSATTSAAAYRGVTIEDILDRGQWSSDSNWQKFYNREIQSGNSRFQESLFKKKL
jgi:integrase